MKYFELTSEISDKKTKVEHDDDHGVEGPSEGQFRDLGHVERTYDSQRAAGHSYKNCFFQNDYYDLELWKGANL